MLKSVSLELIKAMMRLIHSTAAISAAANIKKPTMLIAKENLNLRV